MNTTLNKILGTVPFMRKILLVLSFVAFIVQTLHAQQFQAEGTITCFVFNKNNKVENKIEKRFIVDSSGVQWKIHTFDVGEANAQNSVYLYTEAGYDGTNIFYLQMDDTNKAGLYGLKNFLTEKNFCPATGRVLKADSPPCLELDYVYPVWLAYCSFSYLSNHIGGKIVAPVWSQSGSYSRPPPKTEEVAKWDLNSSSFVKKMEWFSDGTFTVTDHDGSNKTIKMPPPYDNGFLQASMETVSETNFNGMLLPQQYVIKTFFPNWDSKGDTNLNIITSFVVNLDAVRAVTDFSCFPALNIKTLVKDYRVSINNNNDPVSYVSTTNWNTEKEVEAKLHNAGLYGGESKTPFRGRAVVLLMMVGMTGVFLVVIRVMKVNRKQK